MKILLTGEIGSGKSTLSKKLCENLYPNFSCSGFLTNKLVLDSEHNDVGHVYMHPVQGPFLYENSNCIADLKGNGTFLPHLEVIETLGISLLKNIPSDHMVLLDEIGFIESNAPLFSSKILEIFEENPNILAVIKPNKTPLLDYLRSLSNTKLYVVTPGNRDILYHQILNEHPLYKGSC